MALFLERGETLPDGLRRILLDILQDLGNRLRERTPETNDEVIHQLRKRLKRARAVLRLAEGLFKSSVLQGETRAFRDIARLFSDARDAAVLVQTLDELRQDEPDDGFLDLRRHLLERQGSAMSDLLHDEGPFLSAAQLILASRLRIERAKTRTGPWTGLESIYRAGRKDFRALDDDATPEDWHDLRKQVKLLWHALETLRPIHPAVLNRRVETSEKLAKLLGREHDLFILLDVLGDEATPAADRSALAAHIEDERLKCRRQAMALASELYREPVKTWTSIMLSYWHGWAESQP